MNKIRTFSPFTLIVAFVCLSLVGLVLVPLLPVKLSPSRNLPGLTVSYSMPGNSSRVIETEVTSRIEGMLSRVKGVKGVNSESDNGSGSITLELDKYADMDLVRFEVSTIIRQVWPELPEGVSYPQIHTRRSDEKASRPFMTYTLNAPSTPILIQRYAEEYIKPVLGQLKGIYKIDLTGATPMEWQLEYDNRQLEQLDISLNDIQTAINLHYDKEFLGICSIEKDADGKEWMRIIRTSTGEEGEFRPSDIQLTTRDGKIVALEKLVKVRHVESAPTSYYRINGLNSVYMNLTAEETANQLDLSSRVKRVMNELQGRMPAGYEVHINYDATEYISKELDTIYFRTGLTVFILLVFVALITWNLRYLLLIVLSLSANLAVAVIFYYLFGLEMQLYSLAGITISLNLVIDNTIVMTDHILHRRNLKAFMSVMAATLTTIGALVIIFFLDEKIRLNLQDFAAVVIINLAVSLFIALFLVPALIEKLGVVRKKGVGKHRWVKRMGVRFSHFYLKLIGGLCRYRVVACILLVLGFGLPVFMLPEKLEGEGTWEALYNKLFANDTYKEKVKPIVDKALGGSLRLFVDKVYEGSYFGRDESEVVLSVYANQPNGTTLEQMNNVVKKMETYLTEFNEIKQFQTSIYSPRRASIQIYFKKEHQHSGFPYVLKANIISKAVQLGGGSWNVYGLQDQGFSNDVRESAGSFQVKMYGYNYDELTYWAERLKEKLLEHRRIKEVIINSEFSWWKDDYSEYYLELNKERMAKENVSAMQLFSVLRPVFGRDIDCGNILYDNQSEQLKLTSSQSREYDVWGLMNQPFKVNGKSYKLSDLATVEKGLSPKKVAKEKQQYRLCLQYEYIGSNEQGRKILKKDLEEFNRMLPMGYIAEDENRRWSWGDDDNKQYALLLVVIAIIFFIASILFNSLKQPLAIIFVIPISYIGVFLTFYLFGLNFDQGGFASFVLLCGITVNASIYILNEYNAIRHRYPKLNQWRAYVKAWNAKIIPIFLTVVSTILGFIPFMVGESKEAFWFPLAAGTIGGLVMSLVGLFFYLPIFTLKKKEAMISRCYLEITNVCNLSCAFCPKTKRVKRFMGIEEFDTLTDKLKGKVRFLYFHLMGEPLLHPHLPAFVRMAKSKDFVPVLTTNGTCLEGAQSVIDAAPYKIQISLHSHEGNGKNHPEEYISSVMNFARKAASRGTIVVLRLWNQGGYEQNNETILELMARYQPRPWEERSDGWKLSANLYLEYDRMFEWPDTGGEEYGEDAVFCYALRNQIGVLVDGSVVPCCLDHDGDIVLGNLFEQSLDEILLSSRAKALYDGFTRHQAVESFCRRCGYAIQTKQFRKQ